MDDISTVRLKTSDKSTITREVSKGDGTSAYWKMGHAPIISSPDIEVRIDGILQVGGYTVDHDNGVVVFSSPPTVNSEMDFQYYWAVFSDEEIQAFIDEAGGNLTVASARALLAMAADAAKIAKRYTLSGGGGLGQVVNDTSVAAKELRATARELITMEAELGESIPAEGLTEIPWTEFDYQEAVSQHIIRNS